MIYYTSLGYVASGISSCEKLVLLAPKDDINPINPIMSQNVRVEPRISEVTTGSGR